jgi:hypothetical protein
MKLPGFSHPPKVVDKFIPRDEEEAKPEFTEKVFTFANGNNARALYVPRKTQGKDLLNALGVEVPKTLILLATGGEPLDPEVRLRVHQLFNRGVVRAANGISTAIFTNAVNAGPIRLMGNAVAEREAKVPLVGFAAQGQIALPEDGEQDELIPPEPHHSHFVIVEALEFGDEVEVMFSLVHELSEQSPAVLLLVNGNERSCLEALRAIRMNIPVVILDGSGGLADEISRLYREKPDFIADPRIAEIVEDGDLHIFPLDATPDELQNMVYSELRGDTTLKLAWRQFGLYDLNAGIQQRRFQNIQRWILLLGVMGTGMVLVQNELNTWVSDSKQAILEQKIENIQAQPAATDNRAAMPTASAGAATASATSITAQNSDVPENELQWYHRFAEWLGETMRYFIVLVPILVSVLLAATNRFNSGVKWILLRSSAENIKREIYRYRARAEIYSADQTKQVSRENKLSEKLNGIGRQLMQSEVNMCALQAYSGTVPEYYADNQPMNSSAPQDDGLSLLTPQQYLSARLEDQLSYFVSKTVKLEKQLHQLQWLFYIIGGAGTLLAALGLEVWIALTTSMVTALTTYMEYQQLEKDLTKKNQAASDLFNLRTWWISLSPLEQSKQHNIDILVGNTERILQSEFTNWMQEMQDALDKLKEQQEEQMEKDKEKTGQEYKDRAEQVSAKVLPLPEDDTDKGKDGIVAVDDAPAEDIDSKDEATKDVPDTDTSAKSEAKSPEQNAKNSAKTKTLPKNSNPKSNPK